MAMICQQTPGVLARKPGMLKRPAAFHSGPTTRRALPLRPRGTG
jgi:hypothetical protein